MKITFWGTRGSVPTPGERTVRYGGNTPCVEVRLGENNLIILDAGTGIRPLGDKLAAKGQPLNTFLFISHPHWDHIQGFPFFRPAFLPANEITINGGESEKMTLRKMISDLMNKIYFPVHLNELKAKIHFRPVAEEKFKIYDATVQTIYVNHTAFALGFRITQNGKSLVYISDNEPFDASLERMKRNVDPRIVEKYSKSKGDPNQRVYDFVRDADVLIHDTTYTPEEYQHHVGWGHSHYLFALDVAVQGKVKKLVLFHHDPSHNDAMVDDIFLQVKEEIRSRRVALECVAAAEGMEIEV